MVSLLFALLAVAQGGLAVAAARLRRWVPGPLTVLPVLVCAALAWDNGVIALGSRVGAGPLLQALSVPRFALHALLTPLLVLWILAAADRAGLRGARRGAVRGAAAVLTALLVAAGAHHGVLRLTLRAERWGDTLRYVNDASSPAGPLPAVVTGLVVLAAGLVLWRRTGFPWLALSAAAMVAVSGAAHRCPRSATPERSPSPPGCCSPFAPSSPGRPRAPRRPVPTHPAAPGPPAERTPARGARPRTPAAPVVRRAVARTARGYRSPHPVSAGSHASGAASRATRSSRPR